MTGITVSHFVRTRGCFAAVMCYVRCRPPPVVIIMSAIAPPGAELVVSFILMKV